MSTSAFHVVMPLQGSAQQSPFGPLIETLAWGLRALGYEASCGFADWRVNARSLVLCPHLLDATALNALPPDAILYNLEQIDPASPLPPASLQRFKGRIIWDYSQRNIALWQVQGMAACHVPVACCPPLRRIEDTGRHDIDVLFFGAPCPRREAILRRLRQSSLRLMVCQQVFGSELDALIARSKLILNVHYYAAQVLETPRISYLLANGRVVVSERSPRTEVPFEYESAVAWSSYLDLAVACVDLLADTTRRESLAHAAIEASQALEIQPVLARALSA